MKLCGVYDVLFEFDKALFAISPHFSSLCPKQPFVSLDVLNKEYILSLAVSEDFFFLSHGFYF